MTLGEGKNKVLKLIDEYSSGGTITPDEDINLKMNDFFDIAQKQVAQIKKLVKSKKISYTPGKRTEWKPPGDFLQVCRIWRNGKPANSRYRWMAGKIVIPAGETAELELEYFASPATIDADTGDDYEFEVAEDAAQALPYFVAAQQLIVDLVVDSGPLLNMYNIMLSALDTRPPGGGALLQNTFYTQGG